VIEARQFEENGYVIVPPALEENACDALLTQITGASGTRAGTRNLLSKDWCQQLAHSLKQHRTIAKLLPLKPAAVQCTFFVKSPDKNWMVKFHQDLSIPVKEKINQPECTRWSEKEGTLFLQAPGSILRNLVAVRVHLDDCTSRNGSLRVVPGSHHLGHITEKEIAAERQRLGEVACAAKKGSVLLMRPLLLHASSKATVSSYRRVLHFLFGPSSLPFGLEWHQAI
jgi:ectoine hydroxylase-related dioxygenase (phytanoyl-CoA dioxygenase family)